jgi:hypothetical protein
MVNTKRSPGKIPPSARPERQGHPDLVARDLADWPEHLIGATYTRRDRLWHRLRIAVHRHKLRGEKTGGIIE